MSNPIPKVWGRGLQGESGVGLWTTQRAALGQRTFLGKAEAGSAELAKDHAERGQ